MKKEYLPIMDVAGTEKETINKYVDVYKKIKKLESKIKEMKEESLFDIETIKQYVESNKLEGIEGTDFLVFLKDSTNVPSLKSVIEIAAVDKVINKTIASKLLGIYESNKKTTVKLSVKL